MTEYATEMWRAHLKRDIFIQILTHVPLIGTDDKDKTIINSELLEQAAKETNNIVDILLGE